MTTTTTTPLGLSLKLSPDAVASLRQSRYIVVEASASQHDDDENSSRVADDESFDGADHNNYSSLHHPYYYDNDDDDDVASERDDDEYDEYEYDEWDQIIMPVSSDLFLSEMNSAMNDDDDDDEQVTTTPSRALDEDSCVQSCYEATISEDEEEEMSESPPPSLPLVVVDLERLCGFRPSTREEAHELKQQVMEALSRNDDDDDDDGTMTTTPHKHDCPSRHGHYFEVRVQELFESHMAHHGDSASLLFPSSTTMDANDFSKAIIPYPELTCRGSKSDTHPPTTTARLWKRLLQPHRIAVVDRLRGHLRNCNRPLSWKVDMSHELHKLLRQEEQQHRASLQLEHWKTQGRKVRLDQLYRVREVFALRLEAAKDQLRVLKKHKWNHDVATKELERLRWTTESTAGDGSSSSLAATAAAALDDFDKDWNGFGRTTTSHSCHDRGYDSTSPNDDDDDDKHFLESTTGGDAAALQPPAVDVKERSKKARQRTSAITKTRKCRLQSQQEAARIEQAAAYAEEEEERVRELCMTPELKMALAVVKSLEERMQQVDDLLESLQEEEWTDEENGIFWQTRAESTASENRVSSSSSSMPDAPPTTAKMATELSLLDGVLAMILGSLPRSTEISTAEHYKFIHKEHQEIVSEWKKYFGRLPSPSPRRVGRVDTVDTATRPVPRKLVPSNDSDCLARPPTVEELKKSLGITDNSELDWDDLDDDEAKELAHPPRPKKSAVGLRPGGKAIR